MKLLSQYLTIPLLLCLIGTAQAQDTTALKKLTTVTLTTSVKRKMEQLPGNVTIIPVAPYYATNQTALDLFRRSSGVRVRQNGGYGSHTDFFINGITGKQVKFFIDGIPVDNMGGTQGIGILPLEQAERFEVYKGVVPITMGSDALGGAVNLVTRKESRNVLDATIAAGSFDTRKINIYAQQYFSKHYYATIAGSWNSAANNYSIDAEVPNATGNIEIKKVKRFHNAFNFKNIKFITGFVNTAWCDAFSIELQAAGTFSELQHNLIMRQPYGQANFSDDLAGGQIRYQKKLFNKWEIHLFAAYNRTQSVFTDTTLSVYNWEGKVVDRRFTGGEISSSGNLLTTTTDVFTTRQVISYSIGQHSTLVLANTFQQFNRTGNDPVATKFYGFDLFKNPQSFIKNITGISLETKWLQGKLLQISSIKNYYGQAKGNRLKDFSFEPINLSYNKIGYNTAFTYFVNTQWHIKASYEKAVRLPDETELFGDLVLIRANPGLLPEQSDNINLNLAFANNHGNAEATVFYRNVKNSIFLPPAVLFSQYSSLLRMRGLGIELSGRYRFFEKLSAEANITYQDLRNRSSVDFGGINNERYFNARMPNIPYLFANIGLQYTCKSIGKSALQLQAYWYTSFSNEYFLYWAKDGDRDLKNKIPTQIVHTSGLSILHKSGGWSVSGEANNVFNNKVYDNFKVQLPGRNISIKLRYSIFKPIKNQ